MREGTSKRLGIEVLEGRNLPAVTAALAAGALTVNGDADDNNIHLQFDAASAQLVVRSYEGEVARFGLGSVATITVNGGDGNDVLRIDQDISRPTVFNGGAGDDVLLGGSNATTFNGGTGNDKLRAGTGATTFNSDGGTNVLFNIKPGDTVIPGANDTQFAALPIILPPSNATTVLTTDDVDRLLNRASAATASQDAIIAIVDRNGRLLGLRVEAAVDPSLQTGAGLVFAADGALALARTGAFFGNNQAPLTSRTIQFISQTTMTEREIESYPSITDPNSTLRGPGFVAPIGIKNHFPPNVMFTPQVDLFAIEHTNRDSIMHPGNDQIKGTADDVLLPSRFNVPTQFIPAGQGLFPPESYGRLSGIQSGAQSRGIGTLPGGIPLYKDGILVGGIGVFFPGKTGFASESNSILDAKYDASKPDRTLEAEYIAFAAAGGSSSAGFSIGAINGIAPLSGFDLPSGRIDLVGITLDIFGPGGVRGTEKLVGIGRAIGEGINSGANRTVDGANTLLNGLPVPEGWLVTPRDGVGITAAEVQRIIMQGINQAVDTRAAIRLPFNSPTSMVFAVADRQGDIVGLFRMPDATVFSIDVAVAKARNVAYYNNAGLLQPIDQIDGAAPGTAITNRSVRYVALPRYPEGIDGRPPGQYSILNDGGVDPNTGLQVGPRLPASAYQSVQGHDAFNPGTNFHDPFNKLNQNGIVFFPGSSGVYRGGLLVGGFGVSGDGVDQDDVVTGQGILGFEAPDPLRIDAVFSRGVRVPYMKFNRNPEGGLK